MPINITVELVQNLRDQNAELRAQNTALLEQLAQLNATVEALNQTIKELQEQKNKNSKNSSKPPSSDGLKKGTKDKGLREPSGKKQGAQPGHSGTHMVITREPDTTQTFIPDACMNCPNWKKCKGTACVGETRYKVDVKVIQTLDSYESMEVKCPKTNQILKGTFPSDIKGQIQYGESIASLIVTLNTVGAVSAKRTQEILGSLFDLPISTGTVLKMVYCPSFHWHIISATDFGRKTLRILLSVFGSFRTRTVLLRVLSSGKTRITSLPFSSWMAAFSTHCTSLST